MKRFAYLIFILLTATLGSCLFFSKTAQAYDIDNLAIDTSVDITSNAAQRNLCQTITVPFDGYPLQWQTPLRRVGGSDHLVQWCMNKVGTSNDWCTNTQIITSSDVDISHYQWLWSTSTHPYALEAGEEYQFCANPNVDNTIHRFYGTTYDSFALGQFANFTSDFSGVVSTTISGLLDLEFIFTMEVSGGDIIDFYSRPTPRADFEDWALTFAIDSGFSSLATSSWAIGVKYGLSSGNYFGLDWQPIQTSNLNANYAVFEKITPFAPSTTWYATAYIWQTRDTVEFDTNIVITSTEYVFEINSSRITSGTSGWFLANDATSSDQFGAEYSCDPNTNFFQRSLCNMFLFLFYPRQESINQFSNLKGVMENKPPFGYFTVYTQQLQLLENATSTTSTLSGQDTRMDTEVQNASSFFLIALLRDYVFTTILWLVLGFYIYHRFKNISFHD